MYVILIPLFLAANVIINDTWDWNFRPEYSYDVDMTYNVKEDNLRNPLVTGRLNSTVKCRPKDPVILICRLHNVTSVAYLANDDVDTLETEKTFAIRFDKSGVESLTIEPPFSVGIARVIGKIVAQFSVNVNQIRDSINGPIPDIMRMEKTPMGKCMTTYRIKHGEFQSKGGDTNFRFDVLPIPSIKSNADLSISKIRKRCTGSADPFDFLKNFPNEKIFEMKRFNSMISINDRFETFTELNGYLKSARNSISNKRFLFEETIKLSLDSIRHAQDELPSVFHGEVIDLTDIGIPDDHRSKP